MLYVTAVSNSAYDLTSPTSLPHHVAFRKFYAVCAFATVGFLFERSAIPRLGGFVGTAFLVGLYSFAIEVGQVVFDQSTETLSQHGFDVASGVVGGVIGTALVRVLVLRSPLSSRQVVGIAAMIALLTAAFFPTYGSLP